MADNLDLAFELIAAATRLLLSCLSYDIFQLKFSGLLS